MTTRKLRMGMIGGGQGAFIGSIHRIAANMDGKIELVCGALSSRPEIAAASGEELFLPKDRVYLSFDDMLEKESALPADKRIDFVSICTPNSAHFAPAMKALSLGFHVVIDKPITISTEEALQLKKKVQETGLLLCLTHTYSGYPMVKQARHLAKEGVFGKIRKIHVEYPQGWLSRLIEREGNVQAAWRTDPKKSGKVGCMGDIGTHAAHLAEYISGLQISQVCAVLNTVAEGRMLDDDANVFLQFNNGASGVLVATQIAAGEENALAIRVYGEKGGLEWHQMEPNTLTLKWLDKPMEVWRAGSNFTGWLSSHALANCRTPSGHPEGYLEAFGNIYKNFAAALSAKLEGRQAPPEAMDFPGVDDGIRGMALIDTVVKSALSKEKWTAHSVPTL